jgi:hypothetical protein
MALSMCAVSHTSSPHLHENAYIFSLSRTFPNAEKHDPRGLHLNPRMRKKIAHWGKKCPLLPGLGGWDRSRALELRGH